MKSLAITILLSLLAISACAPVPQTAPIPATEITIPVISFSSTITPLPTLTTTPPPTFTPTITLTLDPIRSTPPTIMLHRPNATFDSIAFLKDLIGILKQNSMVVVTYRDIYNAPSITATAKGKLFIITIDDIYLPYPISSDVMEMIRLLKEAGYPAVLGIVTDTDFIDPQTAAFLKELSDSGWEIATHTNKHANLGAMEKTAPRYVFTEVSTSMDKIEKAIGLRPITLILPEGQMVNDARFIKRAEVIWVVGINGGITYNSLDELIYVGRESPTGTATQTFDNMKNRFGF